jgi:23S rRNA (cytosine1962-C5)-methyltransferase
MARLPSFAMPDPSLNQKGRGDEPGDRGKVPALRVHLGRKVESIVRSGHPWVFSDSIAKQNREAVTGELAVIYDSKNELLGLGLYDEESPIRVRVIHAGQARKVDESFWREKLLRSIDARNEFDRLSVTGYRLINGESDGFPGLVADRYGGTIVIKLYTAAWFPWFSTITKLLEELLQPEAMVLRLSRNIQGLNPVFVDGTVIQGEVPGGGRVVFTEFGLKFWADVLKGQKTGFFLDQRGNRFLVGEHARGRRVLNAFSFSGGFSVHAARGGARSVADLDISEHALRSAEENFQLNEQEHPAIRECRRERIKADAFKWFKEPRGDLRFDLIVVDPPSLAKRQSDKAAAMEAYTQLSSAAIRLLAPGGILVSSSCSAHVTSAEFFPLIRAVCGKSRRKFREIQNTGHPPDHPVGFPEGEYLKTMFVEFDS